MYHIFRKLLRILVHQNEEAKAKLTEIKGPENGIQHKRKAKRIFRVKMRGYPRKTAIQKGSDWRTNVPNNQTNSPI